MPAGKVRFIELTYAKPVTELPEGREWQDQIKFDAYRCLAGKTEKHLCGWRRPRLKRREDWDITDPKGLSPTEFREVRDLIETRVKSLLSRL